jgi:hypothetical protein
MARVSTSEPIVGPAAHAATVLDEAWKFWRGSPQLLDHIVRLATRSVATATDTEDVPIEILVSTEGDEETFASLEEFADRVTPEALRRFTFMSFTIGGDLDLCVRFSLMRRPRPREVGAVLRIWARGIPRETAVEVELRLIWALSRGGRGFDDITAPRRLLRF